MGTDQDQAESTHYTAFKVSALAACKFQNSFDDDFLFFNSIHDCAPQYMSDILVSYVPSRSLSSSGTGLLTIPMPRTKRHGEAAFSYYAPSLWNSLPNWTYLKEILKEIFLALLFLRVLFSHSIFIV